MIGPLNGLTVSTPKRGWIQTVRTALGMTLDQLGQRMGATKQAAKKLETNEVTGALSLEKLRSAADALDCDLIIAFRPRAGSIENAVRQQATRKARAIESSVRHTMALEAQTEGIEEDADLTSEVQWWLSQNAARLWD
jgi:predicted DNA-binding mobile mystery protein A